MQISAVLITLNEERRLARALESLAGIADEILVVDSGSTDRTVEISEQHGARVISHKWEGYAGQKNFAASQVKFTWILSLDADEVVTPELAAELREIKQVGPGDAAGFRMPRLAWYRGRWIHHSGWYPDHKLRLYDRRRGRWVGDYVHERVEVDGHVRTLRGDLQHFTCDSLSEHFRTMDRYTTLAAQEAYANGGRPRGPWMLPRAVAMTVAAPPWKFLETLFVRQGFRDGLPGLIIAGLASVYVFWKYAKLCEMLRERHGFNPSRDREGVDPADH
jgi:glycosyltransferase involved in cell wall biosynthesis